ncbi:hypothetical protein CW751_12670 [Brumimicrobium salinarum]|uniref:YtkA-like domain-containing protein n=1 Tax=Brumimicrobium salinarum TaxID=2058658 RepID=A0A2I0R0L3_9FLAO|nr:FixH family protein [Brumimicrobium salinarum]PKR79930.1 hypothetical protein CW751_12670 [Brumimicrobium salinarum]
MKKIFILALSGVVLLASCKKDKEEETPTSGSEYTLIKKDTTANDLVVELLSKTTTLEIGYSNLFVRVKDFAGNIVDDATVGFMPMMDMGNMQHSSPVEQPEYNPTSKLYEGMVVFTMHSGQGDWELTVMVDGDSVAFPVNVLDSKAGTKYVGSYSGYGANSADKYIVTLVKPFNWKVGMNDFSIMVHKKQTMMDFPAVEDLTIVMDPQMTSMGHGSPNNISPSNAGEGYYNGKVNYTMSGDWRLNFDLIDEGDTIVSGAYIDILF